MRTPEPLMMIAVALPYVHPGRSTISWSTALMSSVRWSIPDSPTVVQPGTAQFTLAEVVGREESSTESENSGASSTSCPP